ncbi:TPM domain-containing protein [Enterococcus sp. LJL99]
MKKLSFSLFMILFFFCSFPLISKAQSDSIDDQAGLFSTEEITQLQQKITSLEEKTKASIFILTDDSNDIDSQRAADYFMLDKIGKDENGITFYIDMNQHNFAISTSGNMIDYFTDSRVDTALDGIEPSMRAGNYLSAANSFLTSVDQNFEKGVPGGHYRIDSETGKITRYRTLTTTKIIVALVVAIIISGAFFAISVSKYQLKFGSYKYPFREKSSLSLSTKEDRLINSFVTTRRIPRNKSGGGGSGGGGSTTHSTGGGTFGGGSRGF